MRLFDYTCPNGHTEEHDFGHLDTVPDELPCTICEKPEGMPPVMAAKVKVYSMTPVNMPSGPATYARGFLPEASPASG